MDKAIEKLMNSINNKKEKTQKIKVKSEQKIIKNNFALSENTFTENEYIKIPLLESKKNVSVEEENKLSIRERSNTSLPNVNDEFRSYEGSNPKKVYATRRNGKKVYAEDISDKIYKTEDIKNGKIIKDNVFVNINGKDYFRKPEDAHYEMLNEINKYSTRIDNDMEYGGLIYSVSDGKNIGYASTPAHIGVNSKSVDLGIAEDYYFKLEKTKLEKQGLKVEKVGGYHSHMAPIGLFFDKKGNAIEGIGSLTGKDQAIFFSNTGMSLKNVGGNIRSASDTFYAHNNKSLSVVTPGILGNKNKKGEQKYVEEPTIWLYTSDGLNKKTGTLKYLGVASSYKNELNNDFNIQGGTKTKPNVIYNNSHNKEFIEVLNDQIEKLSKNIGDKQNITQPKGYEMIK